METKSPIKEAVEWKMPRSRRVFRIEVAPSIFGYPGREFRTRLAIEDVGFWKQLSTMSRAQEKAFPKSLAKVAHEFWKAICAKYGADVDGNPVEADAPLMVVEMPAEFWIVVTQWDCQPDVWHSLPLAGPLVHEAYMMTEQQARERAAMLSRYGWVKIFKVNAKENQ